MRGGGAGPGSPLQSSSSTAIQPLVGAWTSVRAERPSRGTYARTALATRVSSSVCANTSPWDGAGASCDSRVSRSVCVHGQRQLALTKAPPLVHDACLFVPRPNVELDHIRATLTQHRRRFSHQPARCAGLTEVRAHVQIADPAVPRASHAGEHEARRHVTVLGEQRDVLADVLLDLRELDGLVHVLVLRRRMLAIKRRARAPSASRDRTRSRASRSRRHPSL